VKDPNIPCILVISDTHGHLPALGAVLAWTRDRSIDAAVFLGDGAADLALAEEEAGATLPWTLVRGNGDWDPELPMVETLECAGHRFFLTHGHRYSLGAGSLFLLGAAKARGAEAALFGHTHVPCYEKKGGILLLNPGSVGRPRSRIGPSFATIECPPGEALGVRFWGLSGGLRHIKIREIDIA
jgi:putative phosphoesterase